MVVGRQRYDMRTLDGTYSGMVMVNQMLLTFFYFSMIVLLDRVGKQAANKPSCYTHT